jgi:hypothetical protein
MSVRDQGTFEKNNAISNDSKDQHAIDLSPYIDYFNERAGIYEFEVSDIAKRRADSEGLAMNDTLAQFMGDTKIPLQSKKVDEFLEELYEATGFSLRTH